MAWGDERDVLVADIRQHNATTSAVVKQRCESVIVSIAGATNASASSTTASCCRGAASQAQARRSKRRLEGVLPSPRLPRRGSEPSSGMGQR